MEITIRLIILPFLLFRLYIANQCIGDNLQLCICQDYIAACPWMDLEYGYGSFDSYTVQYLSLDVEPRHQGIHIPFAAGAWGSLRILITPSGEYICNTETGLCSPGYPLPLNPTKNY